VSQLDGDRQVERRGAATPAFLEYGFRPFFLGAGLHAALAMLAWLAWIGFHAMSVQVIDMTIAGPVHIWHAHEMIFGYALAVVAGFFLTAVPSWTGRRPVSGMLLAVLFALWLAARLASGFSAYLPPLLVAIPELAFIGMLAALVGQALLSGWSKRNFVFLPVLAALFAAAALYHAEAGGLTKRTLQAGHLLGLDSLLLLITVVGGRIVPAFTTNALRREGEAHLPRAADGRDVAAIVTVILVAVSDFVAPGSAVTGWLCLAAAASAALRMIGWRTTRVFGAPILWILHLAYAWLAVGFLLKFFALVTGAFSEITAIHALSVGAIGSMTLGVMTRAALGHTGRALQVGSAIALAYGMVSAAAVIRVGGPVLVPGLYNETMLVSGMLWVAAFALFVAIYWPILTQPRVTARPQ